MAMSFTVAAPYCCRKEFNGGLFAIEVADDKVSFVIEDEGYRYIVWDEATCGGERLAKQVFAYVCSLAASGVDVRNYRYRYDCNVRGIMGTLRRIG